MSAVKELKDFALKGNVVDLAVGVIIGAAFGKIVTVMVEKIIMPPIGLIIGGMDFSQLRYILKEAAVDGKGEVAVGYGDLIQTVFAFLIIALILFTLIKAMNKLKKKDLLVQVSPPEDIILLREIRDLLTKK